MRSVFISDLHLGHKRAQPERVTTFLYDVTHRRALEHLYLVGDIIDAWEFGPRWHWSPGCSSLVQQIFDIADQGTKVHYIPGNHDEFVNRRWDEVVQFCAGRVLVHTQGMTWHKTADDRKILVTHGDQFDALGHRLSWLSRLNHLAGRVVGGFERHFASASGFEKRVTRWASSKANIGGVVCGHIHVPAITVLPTGFVYANTGDWLRTFTAICEEDGGELFLARA
jgi:UDP-2,3-diacylglucosamine pyrophosphatase LpxH